MFWQVCVTQGEHLDVLAIITEDFFSFIPFRQLIQNNSNQPTATSFQIIFD